LRATAFLSLVFGGVGIALTPATAIAGDRVLDPASDWKQREYEDKCRISRTFGKGEDKVTLWLDQGGREPIFNLTLLGKPFANPYGFGIRIQPGNEKELIRSFIAAKSSKGRPVLRMYGLTLVQPELERDESAERPDISISGARATAIETLSIRGAGLKPVQLQLGPMSEQFAFLKDCGRRLDFKLSATTRILTGEARPPQPIDRDEWVQVTDWPAYLRRAEMEGEITTRLTVDKTGKAVSCSVVASNKPQLFDDAVCVGLMSRAKFEPALNVEGEPVASYFVTSVTFRFK
jgi:TonB family protein